LKEIGENTMNNLLNDESGAFLALVNEEGQFSLWPGDIAVPDGWNVVATGNKQHCLIYLKEHGIDLASENLR
jgi:MbtH protein